MRKADEGILLRRFAFGESSLVVHALTRAHGRVHLIAKGAYRAKSGYPYVLDLFDGLRLEWSASGRSELGALAAASIAVRRTAIPRSLARFRAALSVLELADLGTREGEPDRALYERTCTTLDRLARVRGAGSAAEGAALELVAFDLWFLQNHGIAPALERCAACGGPAPGVARGARSGGRVAFSAGAGGRLCAACAAEARAAGRRVGTLPVEILRVARTLLETPVPMLERIRIDSALCERVADFAARFLEFHLETRPRSRRDFLSAPDRNRTPLASPAEGGRP